MTFLLIATLTLQSPWPIGMVVLPSAPAGRYFSCQAMVGSGTTPVSANLVISLSTTKSAFKPEFLKRAQISEGQDIEVSLGSITLEPVVARYTPTLDSSPGLDGVLGADAFLDLCLGFNFETAQLAVWDSSKVKNGIEEWFRSTKPVEHRGIAKLELSKGFFPVPALSIQCGQHRADLLISTSTSGTSLSASVLDVLDPSWRSSKTLLKYGQYPLEELKLDGTVIPWAMISPVDEFVVKGFEHPPQGRLALATFPGSKYVFDFRAKQLAVEKVDKNGALAYGLSRSLGVPLWIENGLLKITKSKDSPSLVNELQGSQVINLGGYDGIDIVAIGTGRARNSRSKMDEFFSKALAERTMLVKDVLGKVHEVKLADRD